MANPPPGLRLGRVGPNNPASGGARCHLSHLAAPAFKIMSNQSELAEELADELNSAGIEEFVTGLDILDALACAGPKEKRHEQQAEG